MPRNPFQAHLCAQDPAGFQTGFNRATAWVPLARKYAPERAEAIYRVIRDSSNVPFPQTAAKVRLDPTPEVEGFMLGVYGLIALGVYGLKE